MEAEPPGLHLGTPGPAFDPENQAVLLLRQRGHDRDGGDAGDGNPPCGFRGQGHQHRQTDALLLPGELRRGWFSTQTFGASWTHTWKPLDKWSFPYRIEFAKQADVGTNPDSVDANDARIVFTAKRRIWWVRAGYELLGGSAEDGRFTTPLATLHKFNGWADRFLVTPATGLRDLFLAAGGTWEFLDFWLWTSFKFGSKKKQET